MRDFSEDQCRALEKIDSWLSGADPRFFSLFGLAGTGKTTLAHEVASRVSGVVHFAAMTGKAAQVLRDKGCESASTIHSLIYSPQEKSKRRLHELQAALARFPENGDQRKLRELQYQLEVEQKNVSRPSFKLKSDSALQHAALVIVDECSMIDEQMGTDLLSFGAPVLALGDPGQLPPVFGNGYFTQRSPDYTLTQIHRQAENSPILKLANMARQGQQLPYGDYGDGCEVVKEASPELVLDADQMIVGRNKTRKRFNQRMRKLLGREGNDPVPGDKLVCLRNDHDLGLLNGSLWELETISEGTEEEALLDVAPYQQDGPSVGCLAHMHYFQGRENDLAWYEKKEAQEFDYGYAITCHKSQGSQWDHVVVYDESSAFRDSRDRWLYTAITRAAKRVTVIRK